MANPKWGTKRQCQSCGSKFYDLLKDPIVCPSCETVFDPEALLKSRRARPAPKPKPEPKAEEKVEDQVDDADTDDDEDDSILADTSDIDDDDDLAEVVIEKPKTEDA